MSQYILYSFYTVPFVVLKMVELMILCGSKTSPGMPHVDWTLRSNCSSQLISTVPRF